MDKKRAQYGFTLMELLVAMGLMSLVLGAAFGIYWTVQKQWERAAASSDTIGDYSVVLSKISREIRAAQGPNFSTNSVNVLDNQNLDIYSLNEDTGVYTRTHYRYNNGDLERGFVNTPDKFASANPLFGSISNWKTVLPDINNIPIFADISITDSDRRVIQVHFKTASMDNLVTFTSRYQTAPMTAAAIAAAEVQVTSITLNQSSAPVSTGGTVALVATINPSNAANTNVTWTSSNTGIASVSATGQVTAGSAAGSTVIAATAVDGGKSATCTITVTIPVTGVLLNKTTTTINKGSTETLVATVSPANATNQAVTWSSSSTAVATVNTSGKVTAIKGGTAIIAVTTNDGGKTDTCTVTVNVPLTAVSIPSSITIMNGRTSILAVIFTPTDATDKAVIWTSSNPVVATVDTSGKVTAISKGTATITVTTHDGGKTDTCTVTVN
jgi:prepilin-type N-terminal cleavage/methylation domain-containing protein